ncbi:uncharacterized [Tachysurus ichikawai]
MNYFGKREPSNPSCREEEPSRNRSPRHPSFHLTSCASGRSVARREDVDGRGNINWRPAALGRDLRRSFSKSNPLKYTPKSPQRW